MCQFLTSQKNFVTEDETNKLLCCAKDVIDFIMYQSFNIYQFRRIVNAK